MCGREWRGEEKGVCVRYYRGVEEKCVKKRCNGKRERSIKKKGVMRGLGLNEKKKQKEELFPHLPPF
jgi:hypothetical protein